MANQVLYGFQNLKSQFDNHLSTVSIDVINRAIQASVDEHNRQIAAVMKLFVMPTTKTKVRFKTPVAARLQPLDENGRARPIRVAGHYEVAFPLQSSGLAWGTNRVSREKMTIEDANNITATMVESDTRWMRDHVLAALFLNAAWTYDDADDDIGALTIKGPANGDTDEYLIQAGHDQGATDNHFLAQADAISDAHNPFPTIYEDITQHPENSGEVITFVPTNNKSSVEGLSDFVKARRPNDPVRHGSNEDILVGDIPADVPGKLFGYAHDQWMVHWPIMPSDYLITVMTGGERPLAMREHEEMSLKGFKKVAERNDHPFMESQWERHAGFGGWNRVAVVVTRVGNATYEIPTSPVDYRSPMT